MNLRHLWVNPHITQKRYNTIKLIFFIGNHKNINNRERKKEEEIRERKRRCYLGCNQHP